MNDAAPAMLDDTRPAIAAHAQPVYVSADGARVGKNGELIEIALPDGMRHAARLGEISELVLGGNVTVTTPCLHEFLRRGIAVSWCTSSGWFLGQALAADHGNAALRIAQHRTADDPKRALAVARALVAAKIANCRTLLRRNQGTAGLDKTLAALTDASRRAGACTGLAALNGIEGAAAAVYLPAFGALLAPPKGAGGLTLTIRSRRPPRDPANALLSYAYGLLVRSCALALAGVGFDVGRGFLHQPRPGRPALALDLMEPFRPLLAEPAVLRVVNTGAVGVDDFTREDGEVRLSAAARRALIAEYERRLNEGVTHPTGGRMPYRRMLGYEAQRLAAHLNGRSAVPDFFVRR
jgi:CRISPR-associated endonuclease Cas1